MTLHNIEFSVLASGSKGNTCYIQTEGARILIDAGLSCREIERRLSLVGVEAKSLDALIITHEHGDHMKGAGPLARRFSLPVYSSRKTFDRGHRTLGNIERPVVIQTGQSLTINDLVVETFTKCHDAADPFGVVVSCNGTRIGLATDLGRSTRLVEDRLKKCQALIIEFNHDRQMLDEGPYPLYLKRRIKGQDGHLSNRQGADLLGAVSHGDLRYVVLAHLSEINNDMGKALETAEEILDMSGFIGVNVCLSLQDKALDMIKL